MRICIRIYPKTIVSSFILFAFALLVGHREATRSALVVFSAVRDSLLSLRKFLFYYATAKTLCSLKSNHLCVAWGDSRIHGLLKETHVGVAGPCGTRLAKALKVTFLLAPLTETQSFIHRCPRVYRFSECYSRKRSSRVCDPAIRGLEQNPVSGDRAHTHALPHGLCPRSKFLLSLPPAVQKRERRRTP